ncbi:MAG: hypothetical protein NTX25_08115 [Proteobacteria bacterium]|nr:hypothetical protein [Pseudomonadota bacterium]
MAIIKRNRSTSNNDLIVAIEKLCPLLERQKEFDAVNDLRKAVEQLRSAAENSKAQKEAVSLIVEAFEGEHELMAYTLQRETDQWTEVEELSQISSRVLSLARRLA